MNVFYRLILGGLLFALCASAAQAQTYDLAADWSDNSNPMGNGLWELYKSPGVLFDSVQPDWYNIGTSPKQPAWADAPGPDPFPPNPLAPMWAKAVGDVGALSGYPDYVGFVDVGTVFMHTAEAFRTGTDFTSVAFNVPQQGLIRFDIGLWIAKAFDRPHTWELRVEGAPYVSGSLTQADPYTKENPLLVSGALSVLPSQRIELVAYRPLGTLVPGTFIAVNYRIQYIPEPAGWFLASVAGSAALVSQLRRHG
jgi:hypothetical protein